MVNKLYSEPEGVCLINAPERILKIHRILVLYIVI